MSLQTYIHAYMYIYIYVDTYARIHVYAYVCISYAQHSAYPRKGTYIPAFAKRHNVLDSCGWQGFSAKRLSDIPPPSCAAMLHLSSSGSAWAFGLEALAVV